MLPKIQQPLFDLTIPSNDMKVRFRPYLVKEEKILLIAKSSDDETDILRAMNQIVNNCVQEDITKVNLTTFDMEYMFLKIRAKSVNNIVELSYKDKEDEEIYKFKVNLDDIEVQFSEGITNKIKISDDLTMVMKYPSASIANKLSSFTDEMSLMYFFIYNCIDTIYDKEDVYVASEYTQEEISEFVDGLSVEVFKEVKSFFENMPKLYHLIEYTNKKGSKRKIELKNLKDFFILG